MPPLAPVTRQGERSVSIVSLVSMLIEEAHALRASDLHLDPTPEGIRVRVRVDGLLLDRHTLPPHTHGEVISRIKVLANLRTDEHNAAQDGRFRHTFADGTWIDVRVSVVPTYHGENAVLRLLTSTQKSPTLASLGFSDVAVAAITHAIERPGGMVLATGPTGSGKTTTLYTLIGMLVAPERLIVTIEDPIEYAIPSVRQIQVNHRTGLSFAHGLRALLRQDPDVMMVGEVRDEETAAIAVNTALTGHLMLSTLHTTDAVTSLPRLLDMGVAPYLLASTVELVIAQRLVRRVCTACAGTGCEPCNGSGYCGRIALHEVLTVRDRMRDAIARTAPAHEMAAIAREEGMTTLAEDGREKVAAGITTHEEVLRAAYE
ncbi:MAG TPA: GspE/PulE family protein [Candidatus Paceibacterota bacterium]|nr:GspE/PulE family protein [Candidatus Paceibacterota bacterium]